MTIVNEIQVCMIVGEEMIHDLNSQSLLNKTAEKGCSALVIRHENSMKEPEDGYDDIGLLVRNFELNDFPPSFLVDPDRIKHSELAGIGAGASRLRLAVRLQPLFFFAEVFVGFLSSQDFGRYLSALSSVPAKNRPGIRGFLVFDKFLGLSQGKLKHGHTNLGTPLFQTAWKSRFTLAPIDPQGGKQVTKQW